ncbi:MAG: septum formation protein Maf [Candidatus Glassbacteria bacterium RBG_16_58_8]|uniref:dTTP/UTP pyrophosphatase n=1 Tax=Candidatus Glassbacteria bacterium RBG_16_58_8 TaxID=1817866 RepID=A0A1F5YD72_9BACT|nr:MAG: septum formation protein Maf [Candidatus Glassbacteria bacterium RBG_16_58_8]
MRSDRIEPIVLASSSPRRSEILRILGIEHIVFKPEINEEHLPLEPGPLVRHLSMRKAEMAASAVGGGLILSADTVVVLGEEIMGKPGTEGEARGMLNRLSGRWHRVFTGLTLIAPALSRSVSGEEVTAVKFRELEEWEIADYIRTGEPFDKAGGYGIQGKGAALVERIEGCYFNVVGLPVARLLTLLRELGGGYRYPGIIRLR